jgi:hypothetical protein
MHHMTVMKSGCGVAGDAGERRSRRTLGELMRWNKQRESSCLDCWTAALVLLANNTTGNLSK